jgi:hypothetical protein
LRERNVTLERYGITPVTSPANSNVVLSIVGTNFSWK